MLPEAFHGSLSAFVRRTPFQPFTVTLVNGEQFEVDRPNAVTFRNGMAAYIGPGRDIVLFDYTQVSRFSSDLNEQL